MLKTYAVIGDPIEHSLSPTIHNAAYRELQLECTYIAYRVAKGDLATGIESLKKIKISGFNVTIPHKIEMMNYLDNVCLLYTSPSPRDRQKSRMPSSA